jgi:hypothetical protein
MSRGWYLNSLKGWKRDFEREGRQNRKRLETLRAMNHPVVPDLEQLLVIQGGWIKQLDDEIASVVSNGDRGSAA